MSKRREQPDKGRAPRQSPPPAWQRRLEPWLPALLAVLGLAVYSTGLSGPFVFDDVAAITRNSRVQELWTLDHFHNGTARPVLFYSLALNYKLGHLFDQEFNPWGYKLFNVLIHIAGGLTLYGLARRTLLMPRLADRYRDSAPWLALAIAALWMVHPLTTEAVTYVVHRAESMAGLCALLVLYCAARGATSPARCWFWYVGAIAAGWIGFGCKEVMIVVPLVLLIYDRVFLAPSWSELASHRGVLYAALLPPIFWLGWLYSPDLQQWVRSKMARPAAVAQAPVQKTGALPQPPTQSSNQVQPNLSDRPPDESDHKVTRWEYLRSQPGVVLHYLRLAAWPDGLCVDYGWPVAKSAEQIVLPAFLLIILLLLTLWALWRYPAWGFLGAAFFLTLAPFSSFVPIPDLAAERRMYLPLMAVVAAIVLGARALLAKLMETQPDLQAARQRQKTIGLALLAVAVVAISARTVVRNFDYASDVQLWESVVRDVPENTRARVNLVKALLEDQSIAPATRMELAQKQLVAAEHTAAEDPNVLAQIGNLMDRQNRPIVAERCYRRAIALDPTNPLFHVNLAVVLEKLQQSDEALQHYQRAVVLGKQTDRDMAETHFSLAQALAARLRMREAEAEYREAIRLNPQLLLAVMDLGVLLAQEGKFQEAVDYFRWAVDLDRKQGAAGQPRLVEAYTNMATACGQLRRYDDAIAAAEEGRRLAMKMGPPALAEEIRGMIQKFRRMQVEEETPRSK